MELRRIILSDSIKTYITYGNNQGQKANRKNVRCGERLMKENKFCYIMNKILCSKHYSIDVIHVSKIINGIQLS